MQLGPWRIASPAIALSPQQGGSSEAGAEGNVEQLKLVREQCILGTLVCSLLAEAAGSVCSHNPTVTLGSGLITRARTRPQTSSPTPSL